MERREFFRRGGATLGVAALAAGTIVPRRDGIVLQNLAGGLAQGYGNTATEPDLDEAQRSVSAIAELNAMRSAAG